MRILSLDSTYLSGTMLGKTNILEAIYLLATLRSFRGVGNAQMVRHEHKVTSSGLPPSARANTKSKCWSAQERSLSLDGQPVKAHRFSWLLRTVVFARKTCS
jgi:recombinational DNA repair ATPase RecF